MFRQRPRRRRHQSSSSGIETVLLHSPARHHHLQPSILPPPCPESGEPGVTDRLGPVAGQSALVLIAGTAGLTPCIFFSLLGSPLLNKPNIPPPSRPFSDFPPTALLRPLVPYAPSRNGRRCSGSSSGCLFRLARLLQATLLRITLREQSNCPHESWPPWSRP